jgi:hypothetical protein
MEKARSLTYMSDIIAELRQNVPRATEGRGDMSFVITPYRIVQ